MLHLTHQQRSAFCRGHGGGGAYILQIPACAHTCAWHARGWIPSMDIRFSRPCSNLNKCCVKGQRATHPEYARTCTRTHEQERPCLSRWAATPPRCQRSARLARKSNIEKTIPTIFLHFRVVLTCNTKFILVPRRDVKLMMRTIQVAVLQWTST